MKNYTFRIKEENEVRLEDLAKALDRPKVWVINRGIEVLDILQRAKEGGTEIWAAEPTDDHWVKEYIEQTQK